MKRLLLAGLLFAGLVVGSAHANREDLRTSEQAVAFANRLMIDISRGKIQQAWRKVKANSIIPPERVDAFAADYDRHQNQTIQFLGQPLGVELVSRESFGRSLLRVTYLMKYNVSGIAWYLYFYRVDDQWMISEFNFDLNSNSLFEVVGRGEAKGENQITMQAWQEKVDARLAALEAAKNERPSYQIDPAALEAIGDDNAAAAQILEMQARISQLEAQLAGYQAIDSRLADLENRFGAVNDKFDAISYQIDLEELAKMRKTIKALTQQHPYMEIP